MRQLELRIPPLAVVAAFAVAIGLVTVYVPLARIPLPGHTYAALALVLVGLLLALVGVLQFRRARTTVNPMSPDKASAVVSSGLYRWSRNPMYLGMALLLLGVAAWGSTLAGYLLVPGFLLVSHALPDHPGREGSPAVFGEEFAQYMATVRRWI